MDENTLAIGRVGAPGGLQPMKGFSLEDVPTSEDEFIEAAKVLRWFAGGEGTANRPDNPNAEHLVRVAKVLDTLAETYRQQREFIENMNKTQLKIGDKA